MQLSFYMQSFSFNLAFFLLASHFFSLILILTCINAELPDRSGAATFLLPLSKDGRTKEENFKLLNGNSGDPIDRV